MTAKFCCFFEKRNVSDLVNKYSNTVFLPQMSANQISKPSLQIIYHWTWTLFFIWRVSVFFLPSWVCFSNASFDFLEVQNTLRPTMPLFLIFGTRSKNKRCRFFLIKVQNCYRNKNSQSLLFPKLQLDTTRYQNTNAQSHIQTRTRYK